MWPRPSKLAQALQLWKSQWSTVYGRDFDKTDWVFPAPRNLTKHLGRPRVDEALRASCRKAGIEGASTHSFSRSVLTQASTTGVHTVKQEAPASAARANARSVSLVTGEVGAFASHLALGYTCERAGAAKREQ